MHMRRAACYRNEIDNLYPGLNLKELKTKADQAHYDRFKHVGKLALTWLWVALHLVVAIVGILVVIMAATQYEG
jgi:hypothetical protein